MRVSGVHQLSAPEEHVAALGELIEAQQQRFGDGDAYRRGEEAIERFFVELSGNRVVPFLHHALRRCLAVRGDLVAAFMGSIEEHAEGYGLLMEAVRSAVAMPQHRGVIMAGFGSALIAFEQQGLERVGKALEATWAG